MAKAAKKRNELCQQSSNSKNFPDKLCLKLTKKTWNRANLEILEQLIGPCTKDAAKREIVFRFKNRGDYFMAVKDVSDLEIPGLTMFQGTPVQVWVWKKLQTY